MFKNLFKRKTTIVPPPPPPSLRQFLEYCETRADRPLGVRMMIATDVCLALGIPPEKMDILKYNVSQKM